MRSPDAAQGGVGPVMARRKEQIPASVSTIVVVAGQTQVHAVTVATVRPAIVPPIVPGPGRSGILTSQSARAYRLRFNPRVCRRSL